MNKKTINRVNGGVAIYYGISCAIVGIAGLIAAGVLLYKMLSNEAEFSWGTLAGVTVISIVVGAIGYSILRVGYEELEK